MDLDNRSVQIFQAVVLSLIRKWSMFSLEL